MNINELPPEVLETIFFYLTIKEKFQCESVCRLWQSRLFTSIQSLVFEGYYDVYCKHNHLMVGYNDHLPRKVNRDDNSMKHILSKCGKYLHSFRGVVSRAVMVTIAENCSKLHCIDMSFDNSESLQLLAEAFGHQLTCATLYVNLRHEIIPFLRQCAMITSVAVAFPQIGFANLSVFDYVDLFEVGCRHAPDMPKYFSSVRNLSIEDCMSLTEHTRQSLVLFTNLDKAHVRLDHEFNKSSLWRQVMKSWSSLSSLSLEVASEDCVHFDPVPPNLEFLSLNATSSYIDKDYLHCKPIKFYSVLPRLKTLEIYQNSVVADHFKSMLESVVRYCPSLEELLLFKYSKDFSGIVDEILSPICAMKSLKQLTLGDKFELTDKFNSKLVTELEHLMSFGKYKDVRMYTLPNGPLFWQSIRDKAISKPSDCVNLSGTINGILYLDKPLPSNVLLRLRFIATINLSNGFGRSAQWKEMVNQWHKLFQLSVNIEDVNFSINGLPKALVYLTVICSSPTGCENTTAFTFNTKMSRLSHLHIYQNFMSNQQLQEMLSCIFKYCKILKQLDIDRGNVDHKVADEYVRSILNCTFLEMLCLTDKFAITDEFGAQLVQKLDKLCVFGCTSRHSLGIQCGPLFLKALVSKAAAGRKVEVHNGPRKCEVKQIVQPMKLPKQLHIYSHKADWIEDTEDLGMHIFD